MTRERLEGLPMNALLELSRKENLRPMAGISREDLIEDLLEAYEEDQRERETLTNLILKMEQSKFALPQELPPQPFSGNDFSLPEAYDETGLTIVLRDPTWALAIWEVRKKDQEALAQEYTFRGFGIKVLEYASPVSAPLSDFLIPVGQSVGTRYIHLPTQARWYAMELHSLHERETRMLVRSTLIFSPLEHENPLESYSDLSARQLKLLELSGASVCEVIREPGPGNPETSDHADIPQRIGNWDDPAFQENPA